MAISHMFDCPKWAIKTLPCSKSFWGLFSRHPSGFWWGLGSEGGGGVLAQTRPSLRVSLAWTQLNVELPYSQSSNGRAHTLLSWLLMSMYIQDRAYNPLVDPFNLAKIPRMNEVLYRWWHLFLLYVNVRVTTDVYRPGRNNRPVDPFGQDGTNQWSIISCVIVQEMSYARALKRNPRMKSRPNAN